MISVGIFDNALARQIRSEFEGAIAAGQSVYVISDSLIEKYKESESVSVYLAIAALQAEYDVLQHKIKKKALTIINCGEGIDAWAEAAPDVLEARKAQLQLLRSRLLEIPT